MSKAIRASALVLLLTSSVQAGWMPNGSPEPPPAPSSTIQAEQEADGWMPNGLTETVLTALESVFALF